jgi:hypothetical protein
MIPDLLLAPLARGTLAKYVPILGKEAYLLTTRVTDIKRECLLSGTILF